MVRRLSAVNRRPLATRGPARAVLPNVRRACVPTFSKHAVDPCNNCWNVRRAPRAARAFGGYERGITRRQIEARRAGHVRAHADRVTDPRLLRSQPACVAYAERMRTRFFPDFATAPARQAAARTKGSARAAQVGV